MIVEDYTLYNGKHTFKLYASEGKVLMRKADGMMFGDTITLGYTHYIGGKKLSEPHWEEPSDYTEVDVPNENEEPEIPEEIEIVDMTELGITKREKLNALYAYDKSDAVNSFFYNGEQMWFPLTKRQGANGAIQAREILGQTEMTYTLDNGVQLTLPLQTWRYLLAMVEVYAQDCYNVTASHAANIKRLATIDEVMEYDFTVGYPEKMNL